MVRVALAIALFAVIGQSSPVIRGGEVTFVAKGDPSDPPRIVADFNGWEGGAMIPAADSRTYTLRVTLDPAARIEYLIAYRNRFELDPGNPSTVPSPAGSPRSQLQMPLYRSPAPFPPARVRGTLDDVAFTSREGQARRIRVYVPSSAAADLPTLYVHDGSIFTGAVNLPSMLDSLIERGEVSPMVVVFIDAVDRHDDYAPGSAFRTVLAREIVPAMERRYRTSVNRRALMGLSRSTVGALDTCANAGLAFDACVLLGTAIPPAAFAAVLAPGGSRTRFLVESGTYDIPLVADARALRAELARRGLFVQYVETPEGHNHTAFRARLPALLTELFPTIPHL